jgi:hypothetical protein
MSNIIDFNGRANMYADKAKQYKNIYEKYTQLCELYTLVLPAIRGMIRELKLRGGDIDYWFDVGANVWEEGNLSMEVSMNKSKYELTFTFIERPGDRFRGRYTACIHSLITDGTEEMMLKRMFHNYAMQYIETTTEKEQL